MGGTSVAREHLHTALLATTLAAVAMPIQSDLLGWGAIVLALLSVVGYVRASLHAEMRHRDRQAHKQPSTEEGGD